MKYIVVTKNAKIVISEAEKEEFLSRYQTQKNDLLRLKGQYVNRWGLEIYEFELFLKQEADNLKPKGLRRCKHCAEIVNRADKCGCADRPELRSENIFSLGTSETKLLN